MLAGWAPLRFAALMSGGGSWPVGLDAEALSSAASGTVAAGCNDVRVGTCRSIYTPRVDATRGVYRVEGTGQRAGETLAWDAILKVLAAPTVPIAGAPGVPADQPYEAFLYSSGLLAALRGGLRAPRCFGISRLPSGDVGVWLERVRDVRGRGWSLNQYALTARHLGELAGMGVPGWPDGSPWPAWLPHSRARPGAPAWRANMARLEQHQSHVAVRRLYPPTIVRRLAALAAAQEPLLDLLEAGPRAISHGDAQRNNLIVVAADRDAARSARGPADPTMTVAIDWANFRGAAVGTDAATLVHQDLVHLRTDAHRARELDRAVFDGYWEGLRGAGWRGSRASVRRAYALQLSLVYGLHDLRPALDLALDEDGACGRRRPTVMAGHRAKTGWTRGRWWRAFSSISPTKRVRLPPHSAAGTSDLAIAHRLTTVEDADTIVVLDGGRVVEQGTPAELAAARGLYYRLPTRSFAQYAAVGN